ncbi:MAG: dihydrodipicolinate reductase [Acidimicrobiia bacterium]
MSAPLHVVQWATGTTGKASLRALIERDDLELVGVRVYAPEKVGQDAGALVGLADTGVVATDQTADILALAPDVVVYMGGVESNPDGCFADVVELLRAGIDVVATGSSFVDIRAFDPARHAPIAAACAEGRSTFLGLGIFPGFWGEVIAPMLSRLAFRTGNIVVRESLNYAGYDSAPLMFDVMGYGQPPDSTRARLSDPSHAAAAFVGTATVLAKALGTTVERIEPFRETVVTDTDLQVAAGTIPAGTVGAMKLGLRAHCGPLVITVEHVTWMGPDVAPEWSQREGYEIEFDGAPTMRANLVLGTQGEDHTDMGCLGTAMHAVHAVPVVHAAAPGVIDLADVRAFVGRPF